MTDTFETKLAQILRDEAYYQSADEKNTELGVVLPLLKRVGWNTERMPEINPQRELTDGKADFDLQIDRESRILVEVKSWGRNLDEKDEEQLARYCRSAKPKIAVLTSGRNWRLYLPPNNRGKSSPLRKFLELDIIELTPLEVERNFLKCLSRGNMVTFGPTLEEARKLHRELEDYQKFRSNLSGAWNGLAEDKNMLAELLLGFCEVASIQASRENVVRFLEEPLYGGLVNEVPTKSETQKKPASFLLPTSPTGNSGSRKVKGTKGWNNFLLELCELMNVRHAETFRHNVLSMTVGFAEHEDLRFSMPVGDTGIFAKKGYHSRDVRESCYDIVGRFGYPRESLVIKDSNGAIL